MLKHFAAAACSLVLLGAGLTAHADDEGGFGRHDHEIRHVLLISVDGLHALDLSNYVATHPNSTLAALSSARSDLHQQLDLQPFGFVSRVSPRW